MYHFDAERFFRGNNLLITSQELILNSIRNEQYITAREQLGKYLHTHQDFYSHSSWIEMGEDGTYKALGEINAFNENIATINIGYDEGEIEDDEPVVKPTNVLKCSHGGIIDTTDNIPALGGINKDVKINIYSPHYYHQEQAANAAIESTYLFLKKL
ncbi:unnamed protein product [Rotaria sp. Silwood2]|nr:unnamed protein product [Rotaria sp. Silwood2]CAF2774887.1 unnamed protein product [Rotaria sp. Silwood2]CAF4120394.1 unnamed protein product [Rotaria sp. Silwood2]CAF4347203.1 unnamed protein product [Rotaria sp. Silwood2]